MNLGAWSKKFLKNFWRKCLKRIRDRYVLFCLILFKNKCQGVNQNAPLYLVTCYLLFIIHFFSLVKKTQRLSWKYGNEKIFIPRLESGKVDLLFFFICNAEWHFFDCISDCRDWGFSVWKRSICKFVRYYFCVVDIWNITFFFKLLR